MQSISKADAIGNSPVAFTWFDRLDAPKGRYGEMQWSELCDWIDANSPTVATKGGLPLIKLATFTGDYRNDANAQCIYGIEGDYDAGLIQPDCAAAMLQAAGIEAFIYTTPSHTPDKPRFRVLCPLSQPIQPAKRHPIVARLNGVLGGILAEESFRLSQPFYVGALVDGAPMQTWRTKGRPIDAVLDIAGIGPPATPPGNRKSIGTMRAVSLPVLAEALASIEPHELAYPEWLKVTAAYRGAGGDRLQWDEWCSQHPKNNLQDNDKLWRSLDKGTVAGWPALLAMCPYNSRARLSGLAATDSIVMANALFGAVPAIPPMPAGARLPGAAVPDGTKKPLFDPAPITHAEWADIDALTPPCIVADMYFADVGLRVAPGGVGKTTLALYEAMCMALCRPIFGNAVRRPGATCILTSEDQRPMLVQRLRKICEAAHLSPDEIERVKQLVRIQYVEQFKLTRVDKDIVVPSDGVQQVIEAFGSINPSIIWIDPAVSFGVGESRVNDAEQGLITAARMIRNAIPNCAVMFIHHTGKANAREKAIDQYSGRGGSALADGSRMVQVMQSLTPDEWQAATGGMLADGETGFVIARPKLSYAPKLPQLYVRRAGWSFATVQGQHPAECSAKADEVFMRLLRIRNEQGNYVNATAGSAYAPKVFEGMSDAQGIKKAKFKLTMDRLFDAEKIENREINPGSKARNVIFPVDS